jgi:proteasome accessory factor C
VISELDDAIVVRLSVSFVPAFVSWLMALGPDAVVLSPPAVVDHVRSWLAGVGGPGLAETAVAMSVSAEPTKTAPAIRWLRRTLAILQFLSRAGAPVATRDLADRFGVTAKQIIADLQLAACCGVPPYGPEDLFEITFSDDDSEVEMSPVPVLQPRHPGQLTPSEVVAVSTAGQVLLAMTSGAEHDLLAVAVGKVLHGLGASGHVRVALDSPPFAETLRAASRSRTRVHIDYFTASSRSITEDRLIEPLEVVVQRGRWYLDAFDVAHQSVRKFRIDRVLDVEPTDETFTRDRPSTPAGGAWPPADAPKVVMLAPPGSQWVAETHPASVQTEPDGRLRIELAVADWDWLETLLLQIGPGVTVVSPADAVDLPARSAAAVLARYP